MADDPLAGNPPSPKTMPKANAKADMDPVLQKQIKEVQTLSKEESEKRDTGGQVKWLMPDKNGWSGDLFDWQGMAKPFDRSKSNESFIEAIKDPASPGTTGDMIVTTVQIDYLAIMERAFRSRHTHSFPRILTHLAGRKKGHGSNTGPLTVSVLEYVRGLVRESKDGGK